MLRASIREIAVASVAVAIGIGWFVEHQRLNEARKELEATHVQIEDKKTEMNNLSGSFISARIQLEQLQRWLGKRGLNALLVDGGTDSSATVFFNTPVEGEERRKAVAAAQEFAKKNRRIDVGRFQVNRTDEGYLVFSDIMNPVIVTADYSFMDTVPSSRRRASGQQARPSTARHDTPTPDSYIPPPP